MTRDDIIEMAEEACGEPAWSGGVEWTWEEVERFAALVAAAERERIKWDGIHSCHSECDKPVCVAIRKAVEAEREACAKVVEEWLHGEWHNQGVIAALMIRERGAP
jgi:hypothetical protein